MIVVGKMIINKAFSQEHDIDKIGTNRYNPCLRLGYGRAQMLSPLLIK